PRRLPANADVCDPVPVERRVLRRNREFGRRTQPSELVGPHNRAFGDGVGSAEALWRPGTLRNAAFAVGWASWQQTGGRLCRITRRSRGGEPPRRVVPTASDPNTRLMAHHLRH